MLRRTVPEVQQRLRSISGASRITDATSISTEPPVRSGFKFAREIIAKGMDGAILLVDVTSQLDEFTCHLSDSLHSAKVPFVVFLNKCDGEGANPDAFSGQFGLSEVRKISAKDKRQCMDAFLQFAGTLTPRPNGHNHY